MGFSIAGEEVKVVLDVELFEKPEDALGLGSLRRSVAGDNWKEVDEADIKVIEGWHAAQTVISRRLRAISRLRVLSRLLWDNSRLWGKVNSRLRGNSRLRVFSRHLARY